MKSSGIGGQAVLEGVMMKNKSRYSVVIRKPDGGLSKKTGDCESIAEKYPCFRFPIIRGIVNFAESLILGMKTLTYSSDVLEKEAEKELEKEKKREENGREAGGDARDKNSIWNVLIVLVSSVLAVAVFMLLPFFLSELLRSRIHSRTTLALLEGLLRVVLFLGYVIAISFMGDIKRVFMYHGAEHKTINCMEHGLPLTVENVKKQSKHHRRCGTSFLLIVMFVSIIFFLFIHIDNIWLRMLFRILLIPVIAGVSYEFIRFAGNTDNKAAMLLSKPGMLLQRLTTREPDDSMIEVAIASVDMIFDWRAYQQLAAGGKEEKKERKKTQQKQRTDAAGKARSLEGREKQRTGTAGKARSLEGREKQRTGAAGKIWSARVQKKKELEEREQAYRKRMEERARRQEEQEKRDAEREQKYKDIEKRRAARMAAARETTPAPKVEVESGDDELKSLDRFFDE